MTSSDNVREIANWYAEKAKTYPGGWGHVYCQEIADATYKLASKIARYEKGVGRI